MKKIIYISFILLFTNLFYAQTELTYEQVTNTEKRIKSKKLKKYVSKNGQVFKVGETLKIGNASGDNNLYTHITKMDAFGSISPVRLDVRDWDSEIIKFRVIGNKRRGYEVMAISKTEMGLNRYYIELEQAIKYGEVQTSVMSREEAIQKLKESKDLLDLELMTKKEYDSIKQKLTPLIIKN